MVLWLKPDWQRSRVEKTKGSGLLEVFRDRESDSFSSPRTHCGSKVIPKSQRRATVPACLNSQFGSWHLFRDSQELLVLQDKMTDEFTLCWQPNQSAEVLTSVDAVVDRLLKITSGLTRRSIDVYLVSSQTFTSKRLAGPFNEAVGLH